MATLFSKILTGEIPGCVVAQDEYSFAIVDKFPVQPGHVLVIPKREVPTIDDLPENEHLALMQFARVVAAVLSQVTKTPRIGRLVEGFGVPDHAHLHLIPITGPDQLDMSLAQEMDFADMQAFADTFQAIWQGR